MPHIYKLIDQLRAIGIPRAGIDAARAAWVGYLTENELASWDWRVRETER